MKKFTAFCQSIIGTGTIWIAPVEADTAEQAIEVARESCAADWEYEPDDVHVLGLATGDIEIIFWEDQGDD